MGEEKKAFMLAASKAIAKGLGRPESSCAVCVHDGADMIWGGEDTPCALARCYSVSAILRSSKQYFQSLSWTWFHHMRRASFRFFHGFPWCVVWRKDDDIFCTCLLIYNSGVFVLNERPIACILDARAGTTSKVSYVGCQLKKIYTPSPSHQNYPRNHSLYKRKIIGRWHMHKYAHDEMDCAPACHALVHAHKRFGIQDADLAVVCDRTHRHAHVRIYIRINNALIISSTHKHTHVRRCIHIYKPLLGSLHHVCSKATDACVDVCAVGIN